MPITTEQLSSKFGGKPKPQSIRSAVCRQGHWCGIRPIKLPNGLLAWPDDADEQIMASANSPTPSTREAA